MVVGAAHGHDLADAEVTNAVLGNAAPLRRIADGADGDDGSLTWHQPGDGGDRADAARIGERQGRALELICSERIGARTFDEPFVLVPKLAEGQVRGVADHRDDERTRPILADAVHGKAKMRRTGYARRFAVVGAREVRRHRRARSGRARDCVPDEMGEGHLARVAARGESAIQLAPAALEDVHADGAKRGGRGDVPASLHVVDQRRRRPLDRLGVLAFGDPDRHVLPGSGAGSGRQHVALGHDAARARATHRMQVDADFRGSTPCQRRRVDVRAVGVERRRRRGGNRRWLRLRLRDLFGAHVGRWAAVLVSSRAQLRADVRGSLGCGRLGGAGWW